MKSLVLRSPRAVNIRRGKNVLRRNIYYQTSGNAQQYAPYALPEGEVSSDICNCGPQPSACPSGPPGPPGQRGLDG
ncbi:unnamed protein product, partial [Cylicostephanus goldi]